MKPLVAFVMGVMLLVAPWGVASSAEISAGVEVSSVDDFYEPLSSQGYTG